MENKIKKVAILTSGGDAPGMNAAVRAVIRTALSRGLEAYLVMCGYKGLVEGNLIKCDRNSVSEIINRGGTIIKSARLPEFKEDAVAQKGVDNLKKLGIDALIVIGGDGSYQGAKKLSHMGINCCGVPGTIDNDIASTDFTIGFDTAVNTAVDAIDKIRDTSNSHDRCSVIEVMGRYCGDIAYASGIAAGVDMIVTSETGYDEEKIIERVKGLKEESRNHVIICITEHITDVNALAKKIEQASGFETRATVLGHIQRGGVPSPFDRVLATRLGGAAVDLLCEGKNCICVGVKNNEVVYYPIDDALQMKKAVFDYAVKLNDSVR